jgi:C4-dicarboxylate transporter DctQ subunit
MMTTTLLLFTNVVLRYAFHEAIFWVEEALRYLFVWMTFIGAATCVRQKAHISLDTVVLILPARLQKPFLRFGQLVVIALSFYMTIYSAKFVLETKAGGQVSSTMGAFPMYIVYSCLPIGFFLIGVTSFQDLVRGFLKDRRGQGI